ncbi:hypothetical protein N007_01010 [Alicyclobacillus acidoterrestris ATCC 49025]|nr:hypothetical protein N007_01010 [Alicyclobacillus acidoterrestris ATCC 49025]
MIAGLHIEIAHPGKDVSFFAFLGCINEEELTK